MIFIYYTGGSFGSTVEYILRAYTNEYSTSATEISADGSMHGFSKFNHLHTTNIYVDFFKNLSTVESDIVTPTYPTTDNTSLDKLLDIGKNFFQPTDRLVLIYISNDVYAEINRLCVYHKIINGSVLRHGLESTMFRDAQENIVKWNPKYKSVKDMQPWEFREWQSLIDNTQYVVDFDKIPSDFLKVSTEEILNNTTDTFEKIIQHCGLTRNQSDLHKFASRWRQKQQYILDEHQLIVDITDATINNTSMPIPKDLNIFAQAIIQQRLRKSGFEIRCGGLNELPKDTTLLHSLLEKNSTLHQEA